MELISVDPKRLGLTPIAEALDSQGLVVVDPDPICSHVNHRFQFPTGLFDTLIFFRASRKVVRAASPPMDIPPSPPIDRVGIDFLRIDMSNPRMTTSAAMTWGARATINFVETSRRQCTDYLRRRAIVLDSEQLSLCTGRGFVLVRHEGHCLGVGFLESTRPSDSNYARMRSMYPRAYSVDLSQTSPFGNPS